MRSRTDPPGAIDRRSLLLGGATVAGAMVTAPLFAEPPSGVEDRLDAVAAALVSPGQVPGASIAAVLPTGRLVTAARGWADPGRRVPMRPDTRLMSGSTGKTFCAATVLSLVGDGRLDLDRPIAPYFRDESWYARLPNARDLTLRILLMHAGGLPQFLDDWAFQRTFLWDSMQGRDTGYSPRRMLAFILDRPPLAPVGRTHHYSDLGYHLVGLTIEKATGRGYYDVLRERVLSRIPGADIIPAVSTTLPRLAAGYARGDLLAALAGMTGKTTDERGRLRRTPKLEYTGGGLAVTPRSLALFFHYLANGRIIAPRLFEEMIRSSLPVPSGPGAKVRYGLGLHVTERPDFGRYVSHSGYYPGYSSNVGHFLDGGFSVAVQINTDHGPDIYEALRDAAAAIKR